MPCLLACCCKRLHAAMCRLHGAGSRSRLDRRSALAPTRNARGARTHARWLPVRAALCTAGGAPGVGLLPQARCTGQPAAPQAAGGRCRRHHAWPVCRGAGAAGGGWRVGDKHGAGGVRRRLCRAAQPRGGPAGAGGGEGCVHAYACVAAAARIAQRRASPLPHDIVLTLADTQLRCACCSARVLDVSALRQRARLNAPARPAPPPPPADARRRRTSRGSRAASSRHTSGRAVPA